MKRLDFNRIFQLFELAGIIGTLDFQLFPWENLKNIFTENN